MSGGTEAFPNLGRHCSEESCNQLDFLPFRCDACSKMFCLDHRSYKAHECPKAGSKDTSVMICPVCSATVKKVFGEMSELTLKKHKASDGCNPGARSVIRKCPVKGCRELLTFSNKHNCKNCGKELCLKHRYSSAHTCVENRNTLFLEALAKRSTVECATGADDGLILKGNSSKSFGRRLGSSSVGKAY